MDNLKDTCFELIANHNKQEISKGSSELLRNVRTFDGGNEASHVLFLTRDILWVRRVLLSRLSVCMCKACDSIVSVGLYTQGL
jgi:hypothetical protein